MAQETRSPGTLASDNSFGSVVWSNPGNAAASDNSDAVAGPLLGSPSQYLKATNFGFTIPSGATITIIDVLIERAGPGAGKVIDERVRLVIGGTVQETDKASAAEWPTTDGVASYGGDLWGESPTPADVNASDFGAVLSAKLKPGSGSGAQAEVDHIQITITYTEETFEQQHQDLDVTVPPRRQRFCYAY